MSRKSIVPTTAFHPAPGRRVRHKTGRLFAEQGESVPASSFYLRLYDSGDLLPGLKPAAEKPEATTVTSKRKPSSKGSKSK